MPEWLLSEKIKRLIPMSKYTMTQLEQQPLVCTDRRKSEAEAFQSYCSGNLRESIRDYCVGELEDQLGKKKGKVPKRANISAQLKYESVVRPIYDRVMAKAGIELANHNELLISRFEDFELLAQKLEVNPASALFVNVSFTRLEVWVSALPDNVKVGQIEWKPRQILSEHLQAVMSAEGLLDDRDVYNPDAKVFTPFSSVFRAPKSVENKMTDILNVWQYHFRQAFDIGYDVVLHRTRREMEKMKTFRS